ncbi:MAG: CDP-2,3-bis-(O-geranylgeranyl)-sn-glycerol synthase [Hadesarchaea archaeon]|nr:MAG: CDP-2,3-bis-(O-geranylgeranyl)-sn-glycerol synthase [Hadesarchaea archaeon]HDI12493.1 CDP-2,3-bis-(O-geranylgeranyl)-sn-glycerol synthase [Hadesarchaea archaeon]
MLNGLLQLFGTAIWFILPAYVANATPVILGGGSPLDGGKKLKDGRPIFGPGKTIRGFMAGVIAGSAMGGLEGVVEQSHIYFLLGFLLSLGALVGDLLGSFIKRRLNIPRGRPAPILDQIGFVVFALVFASPVMLPSGEIILTILAITPLIHLGTNLIAYKLGLKDRPY